MVCTNIHKYIKKKGIKQSAIAAGIGCTDSLLSQCLLGKIKMSAEMFFDICDFLGASPEQFRESESEYDTDDARAS